MFFKFSICLFSEITSRSIDEFSVYICRFVLYAQQLIVYY